MTAYIASLPGLVQGVDNTAVGTSENDDQAWIYIYNECWGVHHFIWPPADALLNIEIGIYFVWALVFD